MMTRSAEWSVSRGADTRGFIVHYVDDPPDRAEAIAFFECCGGGLYSDCPVGDSLWKLPLDAANAFLAANPVHQTFESLYVRGLSRRGNSTEICDVDLVRLIHLPELVRFHIHSDRLTDAGVAHISSLPQLEGLLIYSPLVTDRCLDTIAKLKSLRYLDLQGSSRITKSGFALLTSKLPNLTESWEPWGDPE